MTAHADSKPPSTLDNGPSRALAWGAFLGASWTWCIGMYLPILMVRDLGLAGYLVFAVPNVLGAAAMGWVLRSVGASRRLVEHHTAACVWFSIITLGYHLYWLSWLGTWALANLDQPVWIAAGLAFVGILLALAAPLVRPAAGARILGLFVMAVSLGAMALTLLSADAPSPTIAERLGTISFTTDALWMLPVSTLGFLLCPYLDLTFHRARQGCDTPNAGRLAFSFGFGVCFALMIVFTLIYAGPLVGFVDGSNGVGVIIPALIAGAIGVHVATQWAYTVALHNHERRIHHPLPLAPAVIIASIALGIAMALLADHRLFDMAPGEVGYRVFLSFYGLVFPAYAWLNMIDLPGTRLRRPTPRSLRITLIAIVLAAPFYFVGFMLRIEPWLAVGVGIVLLSKFLSDDRAEQARPLPSA